MPRRSSPMYYVGDVFTVFHFTSRTKIFHLYCTSSGPSKFLYVVQGSCRNCFGYFARTELLAPDCTNDHQECVQLISAPNNVCSLRFWWLSAFHKWKLTKLYKAAISLSFSDAGSNMWVSKLYRRSQKRRISADFLCSKYGRMMLRNKAYERRFIQFPLPVEKIIWIEAQ